MSNVSEDILKKVKGWPGYVDAKYGFRNHWYPVMFSKDIAEGEVKKIKLLGEPLLVKRIDGKLHCIKDRCLHRGVPLSEKLDCKTKDTITCWYHAWTYKWETGELCDIMTNPSSAQIGRHKLKVYPVEEAKNCVFIFLGDGEPHPLAHDTPPEFLDDGLEILGIAREVKSNWRLGVENGFDPSHIYIHKDSILVQGNDLVLPLGFAPGEDRSKQTKVIADDSEGGRKGVYDLIGDASVPVFEGTIDGELVREGNYGSTLVANNISIWLPGVLKVNPWPNHDMMQFEWYVPVDENTHIYFQTLGKKCETEEEIKAYEHSFDHKWKEMALIGFNDDDIWAREAMVDFYADDKGWVNEILFEPDEAIVEWRKLADKHNKGIQTLENIKG
ncbi:carbazole dioxygenase (plasmid) [Acinetobacter johnsonii]|uniref:Carbazole dioxygenase n=1 Tax=Acinetobacter johnsonii TaxID=40214 RepID=A0A3S9AQI6_ACIJO|nr:Rieske 2Fe-2S domain-containing protein [Acinetobacter johnsonii]AZN65857.1 carbazole dioxygenase [Acinetobacter johnsonii]